MAQPWAASSRSVSKKLLDLLRREHGGRLVHDEQLRIEQQAAHDLDTLPLAHRQVGHVPVGVERQSVSLADLADAPREEPGLLRPVEPERHVLADRQRLEQRKMLEHHADAQRPRRMRVGDDGRGAVPADLALVRLQDAVDHLDERRFPGAVLTEQRVDLAGGDAEAHVGIGDDAGKALGEPAQLQSVVALRSFSHLRQFLPPRAAFQPQVFTIQRSSASFVPDGTCGTHRCIIPRRHGRPCAGHPRLSKRSTGCAKFRSLHVDGRLKAGHDGWSFGAALT